MFILWLQSASKYRGGLGFDESKHPTREAAEKAAQDNTLAKTYGYKVLPYKNLPKSYCEECDEYSCICKKNAELFSHS